MSDKLLKFVALIHILDGTQVNLKIKRKKFLNKNKNTLKIKGNVLWFIESSRCSIL